MTVQPSLPVWKLTTPLWCYLLQCFIATLLLRIIFFGFRALAVVRGDFPDGDNRDFGKDWTFTHAFWECFKGFSPNKAHADLWLNALIGFAELAAYPVLLKTGFLTTIGAWLALKTGRWMERLEGFAIAYFWLVRYVQPK